MHGYGKLLPCLTETENVDRLPTIVTATFIIFRTMDKKEFRVLRGEPGLERRKLHDIRHSFLGCLTYEMFQVLLK